MQLHTTTLNRRAIISLQGRFDFSANKEFKQAYESALQSPQVDGIEIDLNAVIYLDSSALGLLLLLKERAEQANKSLALSNCRGAVKEILSIANFLKLFNVV